MPRSNFGHIKYLAKDKYRIFWDGPPKDDGSRNQCSLVVYGTLDDAEIALARKRIGQTSFDPRCTYSELWASRVVPSFERDELQTRTIEGHERVWHRELKSRIGGDRVAGTTSEYVESVLAEISSPWVQRSAKSLWKKMFNIAIRAGLNERNPVDRYVRIKPTVPRKRRLLDASEVHGWMRTIQGIKYEGLLLAEAGGGLRPEEAAALLKEDVTRWEYRGRTYALVNVDKALVPTRCGRELKGTKNGFSTREGVIGAPFASRLLELCEGGSGPLCGSDIPHADGTPWGALDYPSPITVTNNFRAWCQRSNVEYINPGSLRKSFSIMHGEAGSPDSLVALAMGHSDGTTRGKNYQRATRRGMMMIADLLADLILDASQEPLHNSADASVTRCYAISD